MVGFTGLGLVLAIGTGDPRWLFAGLPFTLMLFVMGRYAPTGYRLAEAGVQVERRAGPALIPYTTIRGADREPRPLTGLSLMGSQGLFGRFGQFWSLRLGFFRLYLTNRHSVVWLDTTRGWVALSPDRPDEFVAALRERL